jgi:hypothetical protein
MPTDDKINDKTYPHHKYVIHKCDVDNVSSPIYGLLHCNNYG